MEQSKRESVAEIRRAINHFHDASRDRLKALTTLTDDPAAIPQLCEALIAHTRSADALVRGLQLLCDLYELSCGVSSGGRSALSQWTDERLDELDARVVGLEKELRGFGFVGQ